MTTIHGPCSHQVRKLILLPSIIKMRGSNLFFYLHNPSFKHLALIDSTLISVKPLFTVPLGENKIAQDILGHGK